jgi:hypothetical protein
MIVIGDIIDGKRHNALALEPVIGRRVKPCPSVLDHTSVDPDV